ncbi:MAG: VanW family protein [Bacillota bacterium]
MVKVVWRGLTISLIIILLTVLILGLIGELDRIRRILLGVEEGVEFENYNVGRHLRDEVAEVVSSYARHNVRYPIPAIINEESGQIIPETSGKIIDIEQTVDKIFSVDRREKVQAISYQITPHLKAEKLRKINKEIATYQTIITGKENRWTNIKVATKLINNTLLTSGEVFSFNQEVGPRNKERGFKESTEIVNGELTVGVGGGICQVSSTLYNAAIEPGLEIIELHHHSQDVGYVPDGKDATVTWKYLDLKFKNNLETPIIIKAEIKGNKLNISLLGEE